MRALVILSLTLLLLAAGCGTPSPGGSQATDGSEGPKRGGVLRLAIDVDLGGLDVEKVTDNAVHQVLIPVHTEVIRTTPNAWNDLQEDLATKWEASTDGTKWRFTLRQDAKWHDGRPVTVDDVVYSLNRQINPPPDGITYFVTPDLNTRLASLKAGQLHLPQASEQLKPSQAQQIQNDMGDKVVIHRATEARLVGLFFNTESGPFRDIRLRRAVHLALDLQAMIEFLHEGAGTITPPLCTETQELLRNLLVR